MRLTGTRIVIAVWLAFMVATVGPALFGDMLILTGPLTCPGGHINVQTDVYNPRPGETDMTRTPLCTSADGTTQEVPTLLSMVIIWGYAFLPALLIVFLFPKMNVKVSTRVRTRSSGADIAPDPGTDRETLSRLNELKQAHDSGLITQEEYDRKRKDIVKEM